MGRPVVTIEPGERHNRIEILEFDHVTFKGNVRCICDCGTYFIAKLSAIRKGQIKSCGCLRRELNGLQKAIVKPISPENMKGLQELEGDDIACDSIFRFITKMGMEKIKSYDNRIALCKGGVHVSIHFDGRISCSHDFLQQVSVFELVGLINKLGFSVKQNGL